MLRLQQPRSSARFSVDELLNAAMAYSSANVPSLVGFLQWFDAGEGELKREAGKSDGLVRVMTVHGSKGLQAPIVILADCADDPDLSPPRGLELVEDVLGARRKVPLPPLRKEEKAPAVLEAEATAKLAEREEHWRLLYVAMTRACDELYVCGYRGQQEPPRRKANTNPGCAGLPRLTRLHICRARRQPCTRARDCSATSNSGRHSSEA